jgi:hypothetical protein
MCPLPGGIGTDNEQRGFLSRMSAAGVQGMSGIQRQIHRLGVFCLPQTHVSFITFLKFLQHSGYCSSGQSSLRLWKDFESTPLLSSTGYAASNGKIHLLTGLTVSCFRNIFNRLFKQMFSNNKHYTLSTIYRINVKTCSGV